jgi:hypothetical protein
MVVISEELRDMLYQLVGHSPDMMLLNSSGALRKLLPIEAHQILEDLKNAAEAEEEEK